jgi:NCS1 family nucleobase:cation symporter-1
MFPWTTINLVDFYFVRRGKYNVDALFDAKGLYGKYNMVAISAYVIAFLCEIPFINSTWFVGPLVDDLGGTDIAWIVGLIIPAIIYYFPMKKKVNMVPPTAQVSSTESA